MSYLAAQNSEALRRCKVLREGITTGASMDADGIISVDITVVPEGVPATVEYAIGLGFLFRVPKSGERLLCGFIDGDFNEGRALAHDIPPERGTAPGPITDGVCYLWAPEGESIDIIATGGGVVNVHADTIVLHSADIRCGGDDADDQVVTQKKLDLQFAKFQLHYEAHQHSYVVPLVPISLGPTVPNPAVPNQLGSPTLAGSSALTTKAK